MKVLRSSLWFIVLTGFLFIILPAAFYFVIAKDQFNFIFIAIGFPFWLAALILLGFSPVSQYIAKINSSSKVSGRRKAFFKSAQVKENSFLLQSLLESQEELRRQKLEIADLRNNFNLRSSSAEAFNWSIIASLPSGLIAFDQTGWVKIANQPAQQILEFTLDNSIQLNYRQIFAAAPQILSLIAESLEAEKINLRVEAEFPTPTTPKRLGITIAPLMVAETVAGVLCLLSDITAVVKMREQIALQNNLENLGLMSAGLAHEFKNALASLNCNAQFVERQSGRGELQLASAARMLVTETRRLSEMVTKFLDFAKPQELFVEKCSLEDLLNDCLLELEELRESLQVRIRLVSQPIFVQADWSLLRQALLNMLRNAVEAAGETPDPAKIGDCSPTVWIDLRQISENDDQPLAIISIEDTGGGIAPLSMENIFVPFYSTKKNGHGLGLALAHRIISQHGGKLSASNSEQYGAVFKVELQSMLSPKTSEFTSKHF